MTDNYLCKFGEHIIEYIRVIEILWNMLKPIIT